jgi:hypothetical protein
MDRPEKRNAPGLATRGISEKHTAAVKQHSQFSAKSSSGAAQRKRILAALRTGPKTSFELRRMGVYQHSVRIFELRRAGYSINTVRVTLFDHDGFEHRGCALYSLTECEVEASA